MNELDEKYTWDLCKYCKDNNEFDVKLKNVKQELIYLTTFKGKLNQPSKLLKFWEKSQKLELEADSLYIYAHANLDTNFNNQKFAELVQRASDLNTEISFELSFVSSEIKALGNDYLKTIYKLPEFKDWKRTIEFTIEENEHVLSENEEKLVSQMQGICHGFKSINEVCFNSDIKFDDILDSNGKLLRVTESNLQSLMRNPDRVLRKNANESSRNAYEKYSYTMANNLIYHMKYNNTLAKIYKFDTLLDSTFQGTKMTRVVYDNIVNSTINHNNILRDIVKTKKFILDLDPFYHYDLLIDVGKSEQSFTFEEGLEIVKNALSVLGNDYVDLIDKAVKERWIDIYARENKQTGGYCWGTKDKTAIILLNWTGKKDDLFTLAHELGHAIQAYLNKQRHNIQDMRGYIFLLETASTMNELLLSNYLYKNAKTKHEKLEILDKKCIDILGTVFRQIEYSRFEDYCYTSLEKGEPLTRDKMAEKWCEFRCVPCEGIIDNSSMNKYGFENIWHFYNVSYYVWNYTFAYMITNYFYGTIINNEPKAVENYLDFVSAGGCEYPTDLLKRLGADITSTEFYESAFNTYRKTVDDYMALAKELKDKNNVNEKTL